MPERETKIYTGRPGRPKGVQIIGKGGAAAGGVTIMGKNANKEVTILDKNSPAETPPVVITHGEGDSGAPKEA